MTYPVPPGINLALEAAKQREAERLIVEKHEGERIEAELTIMGIEPVIVSRGMVHLTLAQYRQLVDLLSEQL